MDLINAQVGNLKNQYPNLGFVGLGWIGMKRLQPLADDGWDGDLVIYDPDPLVVEKTTSAYPAAKSVDSFEELIAQNIDGIVISTPSALHAKQAEQALQNDLPVFCQKPLGRNLEETRRVVSLAQERNLSLAVDFSYRLTHGIQALKASLDKGEIGKIYAIETIFHNAYGPDKEWYYNWNESGGGCLIDLGSHLIDLIFYLFDGIEPKVAYANLVANGSRISGKNVVEDFAEAQLMTKEGVSIRLACSWKHSVGKDASIHVRINGTDGGLEFQNVNGSFYEFRSDIYKQNHASSLISSLDFWEGKMLKKWVEELKEGKGYNPSCNGLIRTAEIIDQIYSKGTT